MPRPPLVLVLTASTGAGHVIAARALEPALRAASPNIEVEVLDVLTISNPFFRKLYAGGYMGIIRHVPLAMGLLYDAMDKPEGRLRRALRLAIQNLNKLPITRYIRQRRPALIINTHFLPAEIVAQLRRGGDYECPQATVTTDFETHRMWVQDPTERYYTATRRGKTYLATWGVPDDHIRVTGIPVRPGFDASLPQNEARRRCALDPDRPVVLLLAGAFGVGPTGVLLRELLGLPVHVQIAVIVGHNQRLRERLDAFARRTDRPVRIIGFTNRMHEWMRAADLAVSKAGGLTVSEALACGLPLAIVNPIPGQESRNSDYLLEHAAAIKVNHPRLLADRIGGLVTNRGRLQEFRAAARRIAHPDSARIIAADALELLSTV